MTDVAQILGIGESSTAEGMPAPPSRAMKLKTAGQPAFLGGRMLSTLRTTSNNTMDTTELPPAVPAAVKVGNRSIDPKNPARKWAWAPFTSSSRTDGLVLHHWVRAGVEYPDYPYARFDIHLDPVSYSSDEYKSYLTSETWTKGETDLLMDMARRFELRWAVIHDRWIEVFQEEEGQDTPSEEMNQVSKERDKIQQESKEKSAKCPQDKRLKMRKVEELQHRYYSVAALLTQSRVSTEAAAEVKALEAAAPEDASRRASDQLLLEVAAARALAASDPEHQPLINNIGSGTSNKVFDIEQERERRAQIDALWDRPKEQEEEEATLRVALKQIETKLRKLKKSGAHLAASNKKTSSTSGGTANPATVIEQAFGAAPVPTPRHPFKQSGRLAPPTGVNKVLLNRLDSVLRTLHIPERPLPTKRVCDLYDILRKEILALVILQKNALQREGLVQARRLKLAKMGGNVRVVDEETLMGITSSSRKAAASSRSSVVSGTSTGGAKKSSKSGGSGGVNTTGGKEAKSSNEAEKKPRKPAVKRKRKTESGKSPVPGASITAPSATQVVTKPDTTASKTAPVAKKRARKS